MAAFLDAGTLMGKAAFRLDDTGVDRTGEGTDPLWW